MNSKLPAQVDLPPQTIFNGGYTQIYWDYLRNTLIGLPIDVTINPGLKEVYHSAFEFRVDGVLAAYDYSNYLVIPAAHEQYSHWFRLHYTEAFTAHPHLHSFPTISFLDWHQYATLQANYAYEATGKMVLHAQAFDFLTVRTTAREKDLYARRKQARDILTANFRDRLETTIREQADFWVAAMRSLVSVHIPGSWRHSLDRGQHQLIGFGVCTISPDIWSSCLDGRVEPWEHYVPIRDDYSDLVEQVSWCDANRDECRAIGQRAKRWFREHSTPLAIWSSVAKIIHSGIS